MDSSDYRASVTPKKSSRKSAGFSPVLVQESPAGQSPQAGNLTGNPRIVRDNAAELYNLIQDWNTNHLNGVTILSNITTVKLANLKATGHEHADDYPPEISTLVENLDDVCQKMTEIVERMSGILKEMNAITKLEYLRHKGQTPMFLTWTSEKFGDTTDVIHESYLKELQLKCYIKENIAHSFNRNDILFYSAAWLHQPYVDDSVDLRLESMLKETGHR